MPKSNGPSSRGTSLDPDPDQTHPNSARRCRCESICCDRHRANEPAPRKRKKPGKRVKLAIIAAITTISIALIEHESFATALDHWWPITPVKSDCQRVPQEPSASAIERN
jgi:hypothetical protein